MKIYLYHKQEARTANRDLFYPNTEVRAFVLARVKYIEEEEPFLTIDLEQLDTKDQKAVKEYGFAVITEQIHNKIA